MTRDFALDEAQSLRILLMADVKENADAGAAGTEYQTVRALRSLGHSVDTVWADDLGRKIRHGNLHYLLELPRAYRRVMQRRLAAKSYDVVHVNQPHGFAAARSLRDRHGAPVFIHRSHGFEPRMERDLAPWRAQYVAETKSVSRRVASAAMSRALGHNYAQIAQWADGHIVSATECADCLRNTLGVPADSVVVVPQAVPSEFFADQKATSNADARMDRVLYVGQLAFFKAPMIVARAMSVIARERPSAAFTWVCAREHHADVRRLFDDDVVRRLHLVDWMPQAQLINIYDAHGIFLFPSFAEGFGKVFLEAMARRECVVAADNSGARAIIRSNVDGILVPTGDAEAVARAAIGLMDSPDRARAMGDAAAATARAYTWERVARETATFYRRRLAAKTA